MEEVALELNQGRISPGLCWGGYCTRHSFHVGKAPRGIAEATRRLGGLSHYLCFCGSREGGAEAALPAVSLPSWGKHWLNNVQQVTYSP